MILARSQTKHFPLTHHDNFSQNEAQNTCAVTYYKTRGLYALMSCQFDGILSLVATVIPLVSLIVLHCTPRMVRPIDQDGSMS